MERKLLMGWLLAVLLFAFSSAAMAEAAPAFEENGKYCFKTLETLIHVPTQGRYSVMQGGGTDGRYAYYAMKAPDNTDLIYKYDLETWQLAAVSKPLPLGHANDIAYDAEHDRLMIPYVDMNRVYYVDPETLTVTGFDRTLLPVHRLEYLPESGQILIGSGYTLAIYEKNSWKQMESYFICQGNRYVTQGLTCDSTYIYDVRWNDTLYNASLRDPTILCDSIIVHDLSGRYFGDFPIYGLSGEPENIIWLGGSRFAVGCNGSDSVYLVELCKE